MIDAVKNTTSSMNSKENLSKDDQTANITGSTIYQLEMKAAMDNLMSSTNDIQKQAEKNAKESGDETTPIRSF